MIDAEVVWGGIYDVSNSPRNCIEMIKLLSRFTIEQPRYNSMSRRVTTHGCAWAGPFKAKYSKLNSWDTWSTSRGKLARISSVNCDDLAKTANHFTGTTKFSLSRSCLSECTSACSSCKELLFVFRCLLVNENTTKILKVIKVKTQLFHVYTSVTKGSVAKKWGEIN